MLKIIHIKSTCDDGYIISGNGLCVEHGSINVTGDVVNIVLNDDGKITIPKDNYELLSIETDCGDFVIDLPDCYFKKIGDDEYEYRIYLIDDLYNEFDKESQEIVIRLLKEIR